MATMPIDVKAVLEEALSLKDASTTPVSVSVYLDDRAPEDVAAAVRNAFASAATHARITLSYLGSVQAVPNAEDDLAVIVAGLNPDVGALAAQLREAGVPVMVVTTMPEYVSNLATEQGHPIPEGDLIAPVELSRMDSPAGRVIAELAEGETEEPVVYEASAAPTVPEPDAVEVEAHAVTDDPADLVAGMVEETQKGRGMGKLFNDFVSRAQAKVAAVQEAAASSNATQVAAKTVAEIIAEAMPEGSPEPYAMTEENVALLNKRMGEWIITACKEKKLALALAFPFVRKPLSMEAVNMTSVQNAGIGAVLFIPGADMPIMTLNQAKMLLQIAAAYGQPMDAARAKELAAVVAGGFACRTVARELVGLVPAIGFVVKAAVGYTGTLAMGRAAVEYFEGGGGASGLAGIVGKARDVAVGVVSQATAAATPEEEPAVDERSSAQKAMDSAKEFGGAAAKAASAVAGVAGPVAQSAAKVGLESLVSGSQSILGSLTRLKK